MYDLILEHLAEREKEISEREKQAVREPSVLGISTEVGDEIKEELTPRHDWKEFIPPPEVPKEQVAVEEELTEIDYKKRLRGLSGNRVLDTLKSLLPLRRISGSHHIFQCREGGTYPIAIHGGHQVGIGMLLSCLRHFGITPKEFFEKLS